jgi:hypothetical protein
MRIKLTLHIHLNFISKLQIIFWLLEGIGVFSVKYGKYEQFHPQQPLSGNIHFQIFSNEDYFIDLSSTFIDLNVVVKKMSDNTTPTAANGLSYENCILQNLFKQINWDRHWAMNIDQVLILTVS